MHLENMAYQLHHAAEGIAALEVSHRRRKMSFRVVAAIAVIAVAPLIL